jgi:putative transposase
MAIKAVKERGICIRVACQAFRISESCYRYERKLDAENEEVATWLTSKAVNSREARSFNSATGNQSGLVNGLYA